MPVHYEVSMLQPWTHYFDVSLQFTGSGSMDLTLATWTPGSYLIREYSRHLEAFSATSGDEELSWEQTTKNTWSVKIGAEREVRVAYRIYAFELTVRTSHLDDTHGYYNGATLFLTHETWSDTPCTVDLRAPSGWKLATGCNYDTGDPGHWTLHLEDYDHLVDTPVEVGQHHRIEFEAAGIPTTIAIWGEGTYDDAVLTDGVSRIIEYHHGLFGEKPYDEPNYLFITHLSEDGYGGLEHRNSSTLLFRMGGFHGDDLLDFFSLAAHEHFHCWNVKALRPRDFHPYDYNEETYTRLLWFFEGWTNYYSDLSVVRAGLMEPKKYLRRLAKKIGSFRGREGRKVMSLELSSFTAWVKAYRPDENSANSAISYYLKGGLAALCLDLALRRSTSNEFTLDGVLTEAWRNHHAEGLQVDDLEGLFRRRLEEAGADPTLAATWFDDWIRSPGDLPLEDLFGVVGCKLEPKEDKDDEPSAWLGLSLKSSGTRAIVSRVVRNSPAEMGGLAVGDELVAFGGLRVTRGNFSKHMKRTAAEDRLSVDLFRHGKLTSRTVTAGPAPIKNWKLSFDDDAEDSAVDWREDWLQLEKVESAQSEAGEEVAG